MDTPDRTIGSYARAGPQEVAREAPIETPAPRWAPSAGHHGCICGNVGTAAVRHHRHQSRDRAVLARAASLGAILVRHRPPPHQVEIIDLHPLGQEPAGHDGLGELRIAQFRRSLAGPVRCAPPCSQGCLARLTHPPASHRDRGSRSRLGGRVFDRAGRIEYRSKRSSRQADTALQVQKMSNNRANGATHTVSFVRRDDHVLVRPHMEDPFYPSFVGGRREKGVQRLPRSRGLQELACRFRSNVNADSDSSRTRRILCAAAGPCGVASVLFVRRIVGRSGGQRLCRRFFGRGADTCGETA